MLNSLLKFLHGLIKMGPFVVIWIGILTAFNLIIPIFFWPRIEAVAAAIVFMVGASMMVLLTHLFDFTRILGLGHILWIPLVAYLFVQFNFNALPDPFHYWLLGLLCVNSISLVIDIADVIRYLRGDKKPLVAGL